ncbi:hypothetical protein CEE44_02470 [Candidatus Woesearchaeota archaeon B3_Woes]|nr:MAG: hypothetical protein CEE44_02470 [Candidatus Woesearchaeota archaeon B3_Woes]
MFNDKRGEITLEEVVKLVPHLILAVSMIVILTMFYRSYTTEAKDQRDFDFERIIAEINDLSDKESIGVPIKGQFYYLVAFEKESLQSNISCSDLTCLCLFKIDGEKNEYNYGTNPDKCEKFKNGGKIKEGKCVEGNICFQTTNPKIENQEKVSVVNLEKNNNIAVISPKYNK